MVVVDELEEASEEEREEEGEPVVSPTAEVQPEFSTYGRNQRAALRLWTALARCYGTIHKALANKVGEYQLTTAQFGVLEALYHLGPLTLGELADKLLVTGGNVTYVMDRLQKDGLVTRRRCSEDRRVVWAELTEEGRSLIEEVFPGHADYIEDMLAVVPPEDQADLRRLLKKLGKGIAEQAGPD